jgi:hypothetical protein
MPYWPLLIDTAAGRLAPGKSSFGVGLLGVSAPLREKSRWLIFESARRTWARNPAAILAATILVQVIL